jgi:pimeloyl-ACP methyl ester carboxylesterase
VQASYTDIASYEPNAIKIWARSTTTGSGVTINDLKITTPGGTGETVFPGKVINVSQDFGPVFQEIIIAGIDFPSSSGGKVTLEGNVAMQFGNAPAPRGSSLQFHVIATHIPWVDLDVDSNNDGGIDPRNGRSGTDDKIEHEAPGLIVPVGGERAKMLVTMPAGRNAMLEIDPAAAGKVKLHTQATQGTLLSFDKVGPNKKPAIDLANVPGGVTIGAATTWTLWVEATAPSDSPGDIILTLTGDANGPPAQDIVRATAVAVDLDVDSNNDNRLDTPKRDDDEEKKEPTTPKRIVVNDNDTDRDHVPDYADWVIATPAGPAKRFTPLVVQIPASLPLASMQLAVSYAASDPTLIGVDRRLPDDSATNPLRIWTKNAGELRNTASVTAKGHFVPSGKIADLRTLGFTDSTRTVELYVEGIATTAGVLKPISIELTVGGRAIAPDLVNVVVVSNTLVIGIDGTGTKQWLTGPNAKRANGLWNSHVRNLIADVDAYAMTFYTYGPSDGPRGSDSDDIQRDVVARANEIIRDAGGGTKVALVGWSRGAMIALWAANELSGPAAQVAGMHRTVEFVGLYDPVDMATAIPSDEHVRGDNAARIQPGIRRVTIVGPKETPNNNVDYPVGLPSYWTGLILTPDPVFVRMAQNDRITALGGTTVVDRIDYNASHGAIGGCPGYNVHLVSIPDGRYDYELDVERSVLSDKDIRNGMRTAGLEFVPSRAKDWYGFPTIRPATR